MVTTRQDHGNSGVVTFVETFVTFVLVMQRLPAAGRDLPHIQPASNFSSISFTLDMNWSATAPSISRWS